MNGNTGYYQDQKVFDVSYTIGWKPEKCQVRL